MDDQKISSTIMGFTGLDKETTLTQILPYLRSLKNRSELEEHLKGLIGTGTEQNRFIANYLQNRFSTTNNSNQNRQSSKLIDQKSFPSLQSVSRTSSSSSIPSNPSKILLSTSNKNPLVNHTYERSNSNSTSKSNRDLKTSIEATVNLSKNFSNSGSLYIKDRAETAQRVESIKKKDYQKQTQGRNDKPSQASEQKTASAKAESNSEKQKATEKDRLEDPIIPISRISKLTLKEISQLNKIINFLESPTADSGSLKEEDERNVCFCGCTIHGPPKNPLPPQCESCGLIYCRINQPKYPCPSCGEKSKLVKNSNFFENVLSYFKVQRDDLVRTELEKYDSVLKREREEKELIEAGKGEFPMLPSGKKNQEQSTSSRSSIKEDKDYVEKLTGGRSIEARIREGYENLENKGKKIKKTSSTYTVMRIDLKDGKKKIISTTSTTKTTNNKNRGGENQERDKSEKSINLIKFDEDDDLEALRDQKRLGGFIDRLDDGFLRSKLSQRAIACSNDHYGNRIRDQVRLASRLRISYVLPDVYDTEKS
ncbi:hypothetical protein BY996DRAFT_6424879 [Phakopsora pachyrhizi]|uniref:Expressed protein n=1 Tax=Phakopsora pachyrhizi TaxID=170000 RepID=A0AAV0B6X5_PHAPC|nr:hypothetical protein BY996DRAFT_6424879 [Phakopsora pachyrhizi]CAH7680085.1 expressed protein [Phakopsora pachyrhizi]